MQHDFGRPRPSLLEAIDANPRAMAGFVAWNLRLAPSGLQVGLFGATATGDNPAYFPVNNHRAYALVLSGVVLAIVIAGLLAMSRDREYWYRGWLPPRGWAFVVLGAVALTAFSVVVTQRPRPEYLYGLTAGLLALIGLCAYVLLRRLRLMRFCSAAAIVVTLALAALVPSYYHRGPRPIHDGVERLQPVRTLLDKPDSRLVTSGSGSEICNYLAYSFDRHCTPLGWQALRAQVSPNSPLRDVLDRARATVIYADLLLESDPVMTKLLAAPRSEGWRSIASGKSEGGPWQILVRAN
jgi:hypothetical protein